MCALTMKQPQQRSSLNHTRPSAGSSATGHTVRSTLILQRAIEDYAGQRVPHAGAEDLEGGSVTHAIARGGHDFSRVPVHTQESVKAQTKLTVNTPGDAYEQEADHVADQVMRMPDAQLQRACACGGECPTCQAEEEDQAPQLLQTRRVPAHDTAETVAPPIVHEVLQTHGQPLDSATRAFFAPRLGHDFGRVRVHTDAKAAQSARAVNALAYTVGQDLVFAHGQYEPGAVSGRRLLAHELAHVVQQSRPETLGNGALVQRACLPQAECETRAGSARVFGTEVAQQEAPQRAERREQTPQQARSGQHGGPAVQVERLFQEELPDLRPLVHGVFVDEETAPTVGARIQACQAWAQQSLPPDTPTPQFEGATHRCVFVPKELEQEARDYNNGGQTIGSRSRQDWRIEILRRLTHEVTHERILEASFPFPESEPCTRDNLRRELSELAAIISEFPLHHRATDPNAGTRLTNWFRHQFTSTGENISGPIREIRCNCACADADALIRSAFEFAASSWTEDERTAFHAYMKRDIGREFGVHWPFEPPPRVARVGRHELSAAGGVAFTGSERLGVAMLTYRYVLSQWASGRLRLTAGAQANLAAALESTPRGEFGAGIVGVQFLSTPESVERRFGGFTARLDTGFGVGEFSLKPGTAEETAATGRRGHSILYSRPDEPDARLTRGGIPGGPAA
jgi:hypothetical protein